MGWNDTLSTASDVATGCNTETMLASGMRYASLSFVSRSFSISEKRSVAYMWEIRDTGKRKGETRPMID